MSYFYLADLADLGTAPSGIDYATQLDQIEAMVATDPATARRLLQDLTSKLVNDMGAVDVRDTAANSELDGYYNRAATISQRLDAISVTMSKGATDGSTSNPESTSYVPPPPSSDCPPGQQMMYQGSTQVGCMAPCPPGTSWNSSTGNCDVVCPPGQQMMYQGSTPVGCMAPCPQGTSWNSSTGNCDQVGGQAPASAAAPTRQPTRASATAQPSPSFTAPVTQPSQPYDSTSASLNALSALFSGTASVTGAILPAALAPKLRSSPRPAPTATPTFIQQPSSGLSSTAMVGIGVGIIALLGLGAVVVFKSSVEDDDED